MRPLLHDVSRPGGVDLVVQPTRRGPMRSERLLSLVVGAALMLAATSVSAQQPAAAPPPPPPYGAAISLEQAKKVMAGAATQGGKKKCKGAIPAVGAGGDIAILARVGGARVSSVKSCRAK